MSAGPDLIRDALQVSVNEDEDEAGTAGWYVAHYVAVVGLSRVNEETGESDSTVIVVKVDGQADYITNGLLAQAPEVLAEQYVEADDLND